MYIRKKREVDVLSLEIFEVRLEGLCVPGGAVGIPVHCRELAFKHPIQLIPFHGSMLLRLIPACRQIGEPTI